MLDMSEAMEPSPSYGSARSAMRMKKSAPAEKQSGGGMFSKIASFFGGNSSESKPKIKTSPK